MDSGLTKEEYIGLLKQCGMCTKKWNRNKLKMFYKAKKEYLQNKGRKK